MKRLQKTGIYGLITVLILALLGATLSVFTSDEAAFGGAFVDALLTILKVIGAALAIYLLIYFPPIWAIRRWWKKYRTNHEFKNIQNEKIVNKLVANPTALGGGITIVYAILLAVFGYYIAPDSTSDADNQIPELAECPPGFKTDVLYIRFNGPSPDNSFFKTLFSGKKTDLDIKPINQYWFNEDSIYIERYKGESLLPDTMGFELVNVVYSKSIKNKTVTRNGDNLEFYDYEENKQTATITELRKEIESSYIASKKFWFGTDGRGRDYLSRIIIGVRVSLRVGLIAVFIALLIGIPVGAMAGFFRKEPPRFNAFTFAGVLGILFTVINFGYYKIAASSPSTSWLIVLITIDVLSLLSILVLSKRMPDVRTKLNVDEIIMWFINVMWSIPTLLLVFPIVFAFGFKSWIIYVAVGLTMWVDIARIVRGQVMSVRELEYVEAAKSFGYSKFRTIFKHILPNISGPIIVVTAANFAYAILIEAGLSFLGIGVQPPTPSWGEMLSSHQNMLQTAPHLPLVPGFAIVVMVLSFFLVGNGLRDALDAKTKLDH